ncbi:hypothetical protein OAE05_00265 [Gammaproteobacteria bacterium]|nr:hypothetical protein [Gammaproteobacteria bacterium]
MSIKKSKSILMKKKNPVKKNMDKLHKPKTHKDKTKYERKETKVIKLDLG